MPSSASSRAFLLVASMLTFACRVGAGRFDTQDQVARGALETFHRQYSSRQFEAIYKSIDENLRGTPKEQLVALMEQTRHKWGAALRTEIKAAVCLPEQVRFVAHTQFESGPATEMVTWNVRGGRAYLAFYEVAPGLADAPEVPPSRSCRPKT